ncbi:MAG: hypothetical protein V1724_07325 [Chloroflexota bacterium]
MAENTVFQPLPADQLEERTSAVETAYQLIAITLIDGDILLGCLAKHWHWNGQVVSLGFNTAKGKRYGDSHIVDIPIKLIADIQTIPLSEQSTPRVAPDNPSLAFLRKLGMEDEKYARLPVQDYPNPLAAIISEHNLQTAARHDFHISMYMENALSEDAIPQEGIIFDKDLLLYADWEFFSHQISGALQVSSNIPLLGVSKDLRPSLETEVMRRLRNSWTDNIPMPKKSNGTREHLMQGRILVPQPPDNTNIEGENCIVVVCTSSGNKDEQEPHPVLLKPKLLKYPLEFLDYIRSSLTFYGELLPVPLEISGKAHKQALLARAVAYLHKPP